MHFAEVLGIITVGGHCGGNNNCSSNVQGFSQTLDQTVSEVSSNIRPGRSFINPSSSLYK